MHEYSIVSALVDQVAREAVPRRARVQRVHVAIGRARQQPRLHRGAALVRGDQAAKRGAVGARAGEHDEVPRRQFTL